MTAGEAAARRMVAALLNAPVDGLLGAAQGKNDWASARDVAVPVYAALDLGTNNCRLLIARPSRRGFLVIDAFSRIIRLGEGVTGSGRLSDAAMGRTIEALKVCSEKMRRTRRVPLAPDRHRGLPDRRRMAASSSTGCAARPVLPSRS